MTSANLADWQVRVVEEKAVLDEKLAKLVEFLETPTFNVLEFEDRCLLEIQYSAMNQYSHVLGRRINRFKREEADTDAPKE